MAFCPNCEAEYKPGFTVCPDCQIPLVPVLTAENRIHDNEEKGPVQFMTFGTSSEADMVQELLERNGVRAFVKGGSFSVLPTAFSQEIVLMVDERDIVKARELYETYFPTEAAGVPGEEEPEQ